MKNKVIIFKIRVCKIRLRGKLSIKARKLFCPLCLQHKYAVIKIRIYGSIRLCIRYALNILFVSFLAIWTLYLGYNLYWIWLAKFVNFTFLYTLFHPFNTSYIQTQSIYYGLGLLLRSVFEGLLWYRLNQYKHWRVTYAHQGFAGFLKDSYICKHFRSVKARKVLNNIEFFWPYFLFIIKFILRAAIISDLFCGGLILALNYFHPIPVVYHHETFV